MERTVICQRSFRNLDDGTDLLNRDTRVIRTNEHCSGLPHIEIGQRCHRERSGDDRKEGRELHLEE